MPPPVHVVSVPGWQRLKKANFVRLKPQTAFTGGPFRFLDLPPEIREKIYDLILGQHIVHIDFPRACDENWYRKTTERGMLAKLQRYRLLGENKTWRRCCYRLCKLLRRRPSLPSRKGLGFICETHTFEDVEYTPSGRLILEDDNSSLQALSQMHDDHCLKPAAEVIDFALLFVCKQIYREAASSVFKANQFAFSDPRGLQSFLERLNDFQRRDIKRVIVQLSFCSEQNWDWPSQFPGHPESMLPGLVRVRVSVDLLPRVFNPTLNFLYGGAVDLLEREQAYGFMCSRLQMLRTTTLKTVEFVGRCMSCPNDSPFACSLWGLRASGHAIQPFNADMVEDWIAWVNQVVADSTQSSPGSALEVAINSLGGGD